MSSDVVISVEKLGKRYRIGVAEKRARNLNEALRRLPMAPFRYLKTRLRGATDEEILWALKDVSFELRQGDVLGIIGRNGAGKSTLLKILSRITDPTEGRAWVTGHVNSLLEVGTGFHPELTGRENIYMNAALHGMKRAEINAKLDEIIGFAEIEKFIDTAVKFYSSGMYTRLAFAVAAHLEPDILIVDEVLSVGDAAFQEKCIGKMGEVTRAGRAVLFVSHNMFAIKNLCTRCLVMESGRVTGQGETVPVVDAYLRSQRLPVEKHGEVVWLSPAEAPGDDRVRLRAVRVLQEGATAAEVDISKEFHIEVDYWNQEPNARRLVSVHLYNAEGICILTSGNTTSACVAPDPWFERPYPIGLFRTLCTIPGNFLNDGAHSLSLFINVRGASDNIIVIKDVLAFKVQDTGAMRREYTGPWLGAVRPRLHWETRQLE